jgi:GGDEF domain-containing protein
VNPVGENKLMARVAAAIWASIGAFSLLVTFEPVRGTGTHVSELRGMAAGAAALAALLLLLPGRFRTKRVAGFLAILMIGAISGLAYGGGSDRGDLTMLYTFVVIFSAYFFSGRVSAVHLGLITALLASRLVTELDTSRIETVRFAILVPSLVAVWGLVTLLRKNLVEREARLKAQQLYDHDTGLLSVLGLEEMLDAELNRAQRHARPLSVIYLELAGSVLESMDAETSARLETTVARSLVGRIRGEDHAAKIGQLRFAVLAVETTEGETVANALEEQVRKRLLGVGYESDSFRIAMGWAVHEYEDVSRQELLNRAEISLAGGKQAAPAEAAAASPVPAAAPSPAPDAPQTAIPAMTADPAVPAVPAMSRVDGESIPPPGFT